MTIALGMFCRGGVVIAADTKVTDTNGVVTHTCKVVPFVGKSGVFAIANASNDANSAKTLSQKIQAAIRPTAFKTWSQFEETVAYEMTDFSEAFPKIPEHQLIIGGFLQAQGVQLYFCEPPNTVLSKAVEGYASVGGGASVTDPLRYSLFRYTSHLEPQLVFRQIAYLMYRAKKEQVFCGGDTTAVYICEDSREPEWVRPRDFAEAEAISHKLDLLLHIATQSALYSEFGVLKSNLDNFALQVTGSDELRRTAFRNQQLELIKPPKRELP
jgi:20S proteasome alpha/beta subunit